MAKMPANKAKHSKRNAEQRKATVPARYGVSDSRSSEINRPISDHGARKPGTGTQREGGFRVEEEINQVEAAVAGAAAAISIEPSPTESAPLIGDQPKTIPKVDEHPVESTSHAESINTDHIVIEVEPQQSSTQLSSPVDPSDTLAGAYPKHQLIEDEQSLSASLTRLSCPNGTEVLLIGTAHFSLKSVQDVQRVIRSTKPCSVILELCRERAFMLTLDEQSLLEQNQKLSLDKVKNAIAEKGIAHGLIFIMFIKMSASLTEKLGMAPGAEFRAGSAEAQKIPGCSVVLADRSLRTTIARAVASVSFWQKLKLVYHVLINDVNITQEDVEKCKDKDMLEQLLEELGGEYPGFKRVLLDERNVYLAHTIYQWAKSCDISQGPQRVVAIVGIGHVAGIVENWGKTTDDQIQSLNEVPTTSRTEKIVRKTIKYCALALLVYAGYRLFTPSSVQSTIRDKLLGRF